MSSGVAARTLTSACSDQYPALLEIHMATDLDAAFKAARARRADVVQVLPSPLFAQHRARLAALAAKHHLPAIYEVRDYVVAGGLMSYGPNGPDMYRRAANFVECGTG